MFKNKLCWRDVRGQLTIVYTFSPEQKYLYKIKWSQDYTDSCTLTSVPFRIHKWLKCEIIAQLCTTVNIFYSMSSIFYWIVYIIIMCYCVSKYMLSSYSYWSYFNISTFQKTRIENNLSCSLGDCLSMQENYVKNTKEYSRVGRQVIVGSNLGRVSF